MAITIKRVLTLALASLPALRAERLQDDDARSLKSIKAHVSEEICGTDPKFTDDCYQKVLTKTKDERNRTIMVEYVASMCQHKNYTVEDDTALAAFVKYFDSECLKNNRTLTYTRLEKGLELATTEECDNNKWLRALAPDQSVSLSELQNHLDETSILDEVRRDARVAMHRVYKDLSATASTRKRDDEGDALETFIKGMLEVADINITNKTLFGNFVQNQKNRAKKDYATLKAAVRDTEIQCFSADHATKVDRFDLNTFDDAASDKRKMAMYIHKKLDELNMEVINYADLLGFAPWYTKSIGCEKYGAQSETKLVTELRNCKKIGDGKFQCGGWVKSTENE